MRCSSALLNSKSDKLDPNIVGRIPKRPITLSLGTEPTEDEITVALRPMANAKAVGPDELPVELLKLGLHDPTLFREFHGVIVIKLVWREGKIPKRWQDTVIKVLNKKKRIGKSAGTTAVYHSSPTRERFWRRPRPLLQKP